MADWNSEADNWARWTRTTDGTFASYFPQFLEELDPPLDGLTLEVGCGEGRVARALARRGHTVVALDAAPSMVRLARGEDTRPAYLAGDATALPFRDGAFSAVIAYNSLQTMALVGDMALAAKEAARVLRTGGKLCICVAHPMTDAGRVAGRDEEEIRIATSYFEQRRVEDTVTRGGVSMTCFGWTYTLQDYAKALEFAGLLIERVREPVPSAADDKGRAASDVWRRVPLFLFLRAVKL